MRITVLVSQTRRDDIPRLKDFLDQRYISSSFYIIDSHWTLNGENRLLNILRKSCDILILCNQHDLESLWVSYLSGYSQERDKHEVRKVNRVFFLSGVTEPLPRWLRRSPSVNNFSELNDFFEKFKGPWHRKNDVYVANSYLKDLGYDNLNTPCFEGDKKKDLLLLELYLEGGGDPNFVNEDGVPLLCQIIRNDEKKLAFHLIRRGCDINLISRDRGTNALMEAASQGYDDLLTLFISMGAILDHSSKEGQNALILAMGNQHEEAAKVLIGAGADGLKNDNLQMNALKYARLYGFSDLEKRIEDNNEN